MTEEEERKVKDLVKKILKRIDDLNDNWENWKVRYLYDILQNLIVSYQTNNLLLNEAEKSVNETLEKL